MFFIADATNKYLDVHGSGQSVSIFARFVFEIIFIALALSIANKRIVELYIGLAIILVFFLLGQFTLLSKMAQTMGDFAVNVKIFNKYIFALLIYPIVEYVFGKREDLLLKLVYCFYILFLINIIIAIAGLLLDLEIVRSYPFRDRFGFSGLIPKRNEATLFYVLGVTVSYVRFVVLGRKERLLFLLSILGAILLGTKGIYIFLVFLFLFHFRANKNFLRNFFIVIILGIIIGVIIFPQTTIYQYYSSQAERVGLTTMLLSGRDIIFYNEITRTVGDWNIINFLMGGQNQNIKAFEMDFLDLFFFFGLLGAIIYLLLTMKFIFAGRYKLPFQMFFMFSYFFLAFFGGHFFASAVNALYFVIVAIYINRSNALYDPALNLKLNNNDTSIHT